jgi:hypothetical protein
LICICEFYKNPGQRLRWSRFFDKKKTLFKVESSYLNSLTLEYAFLNLKKLRDLLILFMIQFPRLFGGYGSAGEQPERRSGRETGQRLTPALLFFFCPVS